LGIKIKIALCLHGLFDSSTDFSKGIDGFKHINKHINKHILQNNNSGIENMKKFTKI
jgi:hypothetical protein